ncbi:MAG TPA: Ig-like domain-containing protein [bacterium]|nr:Ig-like domain-containing protein [bacterium]
MRYALLAAVTLAAILPSGCDRKSQQPDTTPPVLSWVYPHDGDTVAAGVYELTVLATDDQQMKDVAFFNGPDLLGLIDTPQGDTYRVAVDCRADTGHVYQLRAYARDMALHQVESDVTVYIRR